MFRRPPGRQQAADDPRGPQRPRKTNMTPEARLQLAREVLAFSRDFEARLPKRATESDVKSALTATDQEYSGWTAEIKTLMGQHPEPTADICLGMVRGKLAPEIANLFFGQRMCDQLDAMLVIADKLDTAPKSWSVDDKKGWLSSVPYATAVELDKLDESDEDVEDDSDDDYEAMVARSTERSAKQRQRGPVRTAWDAIFGGNDDDFEKWLAKLPRGSKAKTSDTKATTVKRPGAKAEAKANAESPKVVKRPGSKVAEAETPKHAKRPGQAKSEPKPAPKAVRRPGAKAPRLSKEAKELVAKLLDASNGNAEAAEAIAEALQDGDYDLATARDKAVEAGINLDD